MLIKQSHALLHLIRQTVFFLRATTVAPDCSTANWNVILGDATHLGRPLIFSKASWQTCCQYEKQHLDAHQNDVLIWNFGLWILKRQETAAAKNRHRVNFYTKASCQPCTTREVCPGKDLSTGTLFLFFRFLVAYSVNGPGKVCGSVIQLLTLKL